MRRGDKFPLKTRKIKLKGKYRISGKTWQKIEKRDWGKEKEDNFDKGAYPCLRG